MTQFLFSNFGEAELVQPVDAADTTLVIDAGLADKFPSPQPGQAFAIILWDGSQPHEIVYCTHNPDDGTLSVSRGEENTTPRAWLAGTKVRHFLTADSINGLLQSGFIEGNKATETEAAAGYQDDVLMTPLKTSYHFAARTTNFTREFLTSDNAAEARRALGWEVAVFSGTGLEDTFNLPDASYDTPYTRVYVNEIYQTSGYTITGSQLIFDTPPPAGSENIVVVLGENFAFSVSFPGNNTVSESALVDGAVTAPKLASGAVTSNKLASKAVTYAKMQDVSATDKVLGRSSAGSGSVEEIPFTSFARSWSNLSNVAAGQGFLTTSGWPVPTGTVVPYLGKTAPSGWLKLNGTTIGSAGSGATGRANADTAELYALIWNNFDNTEAPIQTSSGTLTTRGASAAADFAANKRLPLPDLRAEVVRGWDDSRGVDAGRAFGSYQADAIKSHSHTGETNNDGGHTHTHTGTGRFGANGQTYSTFQPSAGDSDRGSQTLTLTGGTHKHAFTTDATGAAENRVRNVALLYIVKL